MYEYVKSFELDDEVMLPNLMLVRIDGRDFSRFSQVHDFEKPNDETALKFPGIIFAYGYSDEYRKHPNYTRDEPASFFPQTKLEDAPSFTSKVIAEVLQAYLAWRQHDSTSIISMTLVLVVSSEWKDHK